MPTSYLALLTVAVLGCAGAVVGFGTGAGEVQGSSVLGAQRSVRSIGLVSTTSLPGPPTGLAIGRRRVAVSVALEGVLLVRRDDGRTANRVPVDGAAVSIRAYGGRFWFADLFHDRVLELDEAGTVHHEFPVGPLPGGIAVSGSDVWVLGLEEPSITVEDRWHELPPLRMLLAPDELWPGGIEAGTHGVWVVTGRLSEVTLFDSDLQVQLGTARVSRVQVLAAAPTGAWVGRRGGGPELARIDGTTFDVELVDLPGNAPVTALGSGAVLAAARRGTVLLLDPTTGAIRARGVVPPDREIVHIAVDGNEVWAVDAAREELLRFRVQPDGNRSAGHIRRGKEGAMTPVTAGASALAPEIRDAHVDAEKE
jgi:hypothetical protein